MSDRHLAEPGEAAGFLDGYLASLPDAAPGQVGACTFVTPLGQMIAVAGRALHLLEFTDTNRLPKQLKAVGALSVGRGRVPLIDRLEAELSAYLAGCGQTFSILLAPQGTAFQQCVWQALGTVPFGARASYSVIAGRIGRPNAVRAVGAANGANPIAILIPCHRIVARDGALTGYGGGVSRKQQLLALEGQETQGSSGESA